MIKVKKLNEDAKMPEMAHGGDLGYDVFACEDKMISSNSSELVDTGIAVEPPEGWGFFVKDRSSYASQKDLEIAAGVIDEGYRGEVKVLIRNHNTVGFYKIERGDKIAQLVPIPSTDFDIQEIDSFSETERGSGGFGTTGE